MKRLLILCGIFLFQNVMAQTPPTYTSADIYLGLKKLNVLGSVLYVAAHPDDENTRLLAYFSKDRLYRTGYLSMTRGDGGQNLIGEEQGVELGMIRTQELLSARRMDGAEQFFTRAFDFGFSKTPEETFNIWDKEKILADVVWVIRNFQPDVIVTRFPTTGEGGHGHHTASAILANEAFTAAADPNRFPEQLKFVQPWQAKRIVWNTFNFGGNNTTNNNQFHFDVGGFNPVLGKSYGEIAAASRSQHKSQGFGVPGSRGESSEFFRTTGGSEPVKSLFDDVNLSWSRVSSAETIPAIINDIAQKFDFTAPQKSVPALVHLYDAIEKLPAGYWRSQKMKEVQQLIEAAGGFWLEASTSTQNAVQGDSLQITTVVNNRNGADAILKGISVGTFDSSLQTVLSGNRNLVVRKTIAIPQSQPLSQPYYLRQQKAEGYYNVDNQQMIGRAEGDPAFTAHFRVDIDGHSFDFTKPVQYKYTDPVKGEIYQPVFVVPPVSVSATPGIVLFQKGSGQVKELDVQVGANKNMNAGVLQARARSNIYNLSKVDSSLQIPKGMQTAYGFSLKGDEMGNLEKDLLYPIADIKNSNGENAYYLTTRSINYDHIPTIRYFFADGATLLNMDLKTAGKKIGYIAGAGDRVPEALLQMGYEVEMLGEKELARNNLQQFDAIITGVRAYNVNAWLNGYYEKLMAYVQNGGNLIVQYNTSNQIGPVRARISPFEFDITRNRITNEDAAVTFLQPSHPALNYPNKISEKDFEGWIQERSIYHAGNYKAPFQALLRMNDPGEQPNDGSLIVAPFGKGYFTYTGLVFFRELPAGVPGAYRLIANLIALNQKKQM